MEQHALTSIRDFAAYTLRNEQPYIKTTRLEKILDSLTANLREEFEEQAQELEQTKTRAGFFMLPPELRNVIYELVLVRPTALICAPPLKVHASYQCRSEDLNFCDVSLALLQVSRQIREETLPIFHGANTFKLTMLYQTGDEMLDKLELKPLQAWKTAIGDKQFAMIKSLRLVFQFDVNNAVYFIFGTGDDGKQEYIKAICKQTGSTRELLRADSSVHEWNIDVVTKMLPLVQLGINKEKVKLELCEWELGPEY